MIIRNHLDCARKKLVESDQGQGNPRLDVEVLLAHVLEVSRSFLYTHPEQGVPLARSIKFKALVKRRSRGEPIAYLTGEKEFWSMSLKITPDVLIPRPETELLVATVLERTVNQSGLRLADIGTGSGAIALALGKERPSSRVHATDSSAAALKLGNSNAQYLNIRNVVFHQGSWCEPLKGQFDTIASNPPYVAGGDPHLQLGDCRFEPRIALTLEDDGLGSFRIITKQAYGLIKHNGWILFEHGFDQGKPVREICESAGFTHPETLKDLEGHDRVTLARR